MGFSNLKKTKLFRVIILSCLLLGVAWWSPGWLTGPLRSIFVPIALPFERLLAPVGAKISSIRSLFVSVGDLKKENEYLYHENVRLVAENVRLADVQKENESLRRQLELLPRDSFRLIASDVVGQDAMNLGSWMLIDKGSDDGVRTGMAVIVDQGVLVGKVGEVLAHSARVVLLTSPDSVINSQDVQSGAKGVVRGRHGLGLLLDMVVQTETLKTGDDVATSGLGGDIPQGFLVGKIQEVHPSGDRLFQQATLASPVKFTSLRTVFVVQGEK